MQTLYIELRDFFLKNGYNLISEEKSGDGDSARWGMSAKYGDFEFSQMLEGYYLELSLCLVSDNLLVQYDILEGIYSCDIFVQTNENQELAKHWMELLENEVSRLNLSIYINYNSISGNTL